jgi:DNA-binding MarR family transcriptional regulator
VQGSGWLTEGEQRVWRAYLRGSTSLNDALDHDLQRLGTSLSEYEILALLSETPSRRARMSAIAADMVQSRSRLTHTAARLERRGWVRREPAPDDRRGVELCLTDAGMAALDDLAPQHVASVRAHLLEPLTQEQYAALGAAMEVLRIANASDEPTSRGNGAPA